MALVVLFIPMLVIVLIVRLTSNCSETLFNMRISDDTYIRRGGAKYAGELLRFHRMLLKTHYIGLGTFLTCAVPHAAVCVLPNFARKAIYGKFLRSDGKA